MGVIQKRCWKKPTFSLATWGYPVRLMMAYAIREDIKDYIRYRLICEGKLTFKSPSVGWYHRTYGKDAEQFLFSRHLERFLRQYPLSLEAEDLREFVLRKLEFFRILLNKLPNIL